LRFSGPVTPSPPAASGTTSNPTSSASPGTSPGIKTHLVPRRSPNYSLFPLTLSLPFFLSLFTFLHRPTWLCLRPHGAPLTPCGPPLPQNRYDAASGKKCHSVAGWLLFARRLNSIVSSTVWPVRRPLHNDAGEAPFQQVAGDHRRHFATAARGIAFPPTRGKTLDFVALHTGAPSKKTKPWE
jgi:hypothetical protein